jgi:hypothetical protein
LILEVHFHINRISLILTIFEADLLKIHHCMTRFTLINFYKSGKGKKDKAIPLQAWTGR